MRVCKGKNGCEILEIRFCCEGRWFCLVLIVKVISLAQPITSIPLLFLFSFYCLL